MRKDVDERYQTIKELESDLKKLKQRIEFQSELEKSMAPDRLTSSFSSMAATEIHGTGPPSTAQTTAHTTVNPALTTSAVPNVSQTRASSVEYVVTEIKHHKTVAAVIALAVLVAAAGIIYIGVIRKKTVLTEKDTILLTDFNNSTGDPVFDDTLKQALAVQLGQSPFLNIFSDDRVRETLKFMNASPDARITRDVGRDICAREGIKAMLLGSISSVGSHYVVVLNAVNSQTGDTIASQQFEVEDKNQVLKSLGQAASSLREKLGESLGTIEKFDAPIEQVTTSKLEALRQYTKGLEAHSNDCGRAIPFYKAAIEMDPNFAIAHARLANCYNNTKAFQASRDEFLLLVHRQHQEPKLTIFAIA